MTQPTRGSPLSRRQVLLRLAITISVLTCIASFLLLLSHPGLESLIATSAAISSLVTFLYGIVSERQRS